MTRYLLIVLQVLLMLLSSPTQVNCQSLEENDSWNQLMQDVVFHLGQREDIVNLLSDESFRLSSLPNNTINQQCVKDIRFYVENLLVNRSIWALQSE